MKWLCGYFKRKRLIINVTVVVENDQKQNADVSVKVNCETESNYTIAVDTKVTKANEGAVPNTLIESIIKLKGFKAMEPEL